MFSKLKQYRPRAIGLVVALLVGCAGEYGYRLERERIELDQRNRVTSAVGQYRAALEGELNATLYLTNGLVAYVLTQSEIESKTAQAMLKTLFDQGRHVRNLGLAPGNRLTHIYPLAGNEKALGLYYPDLPEQWPAVEAAIQQKKPKLAGPIALKQGGYGLIYRVPVFSSTGAYWGMLSMVIDPQSLFAKAGVAPEVDGLQLALRGRDGEGARGAVFMGNPALFATDSVTATINTPGGSWQLAARPASGWLAGERLGWLRASAWALGALIGVLLAQALSALTARMDAEQAIKNSRDELHEAQRLAMIGNWVRNLRSGQLTWSDEVFRILEIDPVNPGASHESFMQVVHPDDRELIERTYQESLTSRKAYNLVHRLLFPDGRIKYVRERYETAYAEDGTPAISRGTVQDITLQMEADQQIRLLAFYDALTNLPNRRLLQDRLNRALAQAQRYERSVAVMFLDLDNFKVVNDTLGHEVGDELLIRVATRLSDCVRTGDTVARFGGDEFVLVLAEISQPGDASLVAEKVLNVLKPPISIGATQLAVTTSIGISVYPVNGGDDAKELLRKADIAMYEAKRAGRNRYAFFDANSSGQRNLVAEI